MPPIPKFAFTKPVVYGLTGIALIASAGAYTDRQQPFYFQQQKRFQSPVLPERKTYNSEIVSATVASSKMAVTTPFQTLFAVPMHCESCANDISQALHKVPGITKVEPNVKEQLVTIEGTAPPSAIVDAIQSTGRDAILRGSGGSNNAAVSILETYYHRSVQEAAASAAASKPAGSWINERLVRGLARMVQVSPTETVVDLTIRGLSPGKYRATIRAYGNLQDGVTSAGPVWSGTTTADKETKSTPRGVLGTVEIGPDGRGTVFLNHPFQVWEVIGHALAVSPNDESDEGNPLKNDENTVVGIIARSAGVWDNDKTVCSCTGKTLWEERKDEVSKGML
ncbi:superoxide dismutase [Triangularia verruculosa]|uniref:Superoxide dismutase 1 copper chaperone n=1 Tax=Triangularia verruculosa TaxID=2587418 RepID=A0AAN7AV49_9PEZI|nr:superoxide dismutase [Triangularia verruculosa]